MVEADPKEAALAFGRITEKQLLRLLNPDKYPAVTLENLRERICDAAASVFGAKIVFEERAFQAIEVTTTRGTAPNEVHIWRQLSTLLPVIADLEAALGVDRPVRPHLISRSIELDVHEIEEMDWTRPLRSVFMRGDQLTPIGREVARSGTLKTADIALSILQSSRQRTKQVNQFDRRTNLVFRTIAKASGQGRAIWWTSELERFSQTATDTFNRLYHWDPSVGSQQFILYHDGQKVRLQPFGLSGLYQLQEEPLRDGGLWIARGNVIQPATRFSLQAIEQLEELINSDAPERRFQEFFDLNQEFLLALGDYVKIHSQLVLAEDDGGGLIPDFFLEKIDSGFCDICDLKRANVELIRHQRNRERFRAVVMEAVAQLTAYKDWFDDRANRQKFEETYRLRSYRPKVVVIIGRKMSFEDDVQRLMVESQLPSYVTLKTYDDIVGSARRWRAVVAGTEGTMARPQ